MSMAITIVFKIDDDNVPENVALAAKIDGAVRQALEMESNFADLPGEDLLDMYVGTFLSKGITSGD